METFDEMLNRIEQTKKASETDFKRISRSDDDAERTKAVSLMIKVGIADKYTTYLKTTENVFYDSEEEADEIQAKSELVTYESINGIDLSRFHFLNTKGNPTGVFDEAIFQYLIEVEKMFIMGGIVYYYRGGKYIADGSGSWLKTRIRRLIYPEFIKSTTLDRIYKLFISANGLQLSSERLNNHPRHYINFQNGYLDCISGKMLQHNPKHYSINQIPHNYNPDDEYAVNDTVERWLDFITPCEDDREMLLEYCGLCMTTDTRQQKFLILNGVGGSGKSTLIKLLEEVIGCENISNISLKEFQTRFASHGLLNKLLNSCADLEIDALNDVSLIKKILGEDSLRAEAKGKDAISFKSYAKLIFSTNELPLVLSEKSNGFYRRLLILNMNRIPEKRRTDFYDDLRAGIDYFIHLCVEALRRMYERGYIIESAESVKAVKLMRCESDTVQAWLTDICYTDDITTKTDRAELYRSYDSYCDDNDRRPLSRNAFYKSLRAKNFYDYQSHGTWMFRGISIQKTTPKNLSQDLMNVIPFT